MNPRLHVEAIAYTASGERRFIVRGQTAKALVALINCGDRGVTALEAESWAYRLAVYCYDLRRDHGLVIRCAREEHEGGWHGRHVLETPVRIVFVADLELDPVPA
jgi:hypothetical protein